jgi:hypothetical protein
MTASHAAVENDAETFEAGLARTNIETGISTIVHPATGARVEIELGTICGADGKTCWLRMNMNSQTCLATKTGYSPGMVTKAIASLIAGTLIMVLAGCSPREEKVDGSIFIVTKGGENFKLGLVTVSVFDERQIVPCLAKPTKDLEKHLADLKAKVAKLNEEKESLIQKRNIADEKSDDASKKYWESNLGDEGKNRLWDLRLKAASVTNSYNKLIAENKQKLDSEVGQLQNWANEEPQVYFNNLPTPFASSKTDADGKFSLVIPPKTQFRRVFESMTSSAG